MKEAVAVQKFFLHTEYITLGQLLKATDSVSSGGDVKSMLATRRIRVNGEIDDRRGKKLRPGDVVTLPNGSKIEIQ